MLPGVVLATDTSRPSSNVREVLDSPLVGAAWPAGAWVPCGGPGEAVAAGGGEFDSAPGTPAGWAPDELVYCC